MAKYKMKSNSSAKKRFRATASGKFKRKRANLRHCLTAKTRKQKRGLRSPGYIADEQVHQIRALLPYA